MSKSDKAQIIIHNKLSKSEYEMNKGKFATVNIDTKDFFIDDDDTVAIKKSLAKYPHGGCTLIKVGYKGAFVVGGGQSQPISF